ncbi:hypothetical protein Q7P37_002260 [Cladosporium fusiforme]
MAVGTTNPASEGSSKQFHIFGRGISFSMSPTIHNSGFQHHALPYSYKITEVESVSDCLSPISMSNFGGASVTMPYKLEISKYCDFVTKEAQLVGAVNTLCVKHEADGQRMIEGDNTDWTGILSCIKAKFPKQADGPPKVGWVIGAGGAARAAVYALHVAGTERIFLSNRTRSKAEAIASAFSSQFIVEIVDEWKDMNAHPADIVIGTIPADTVCDADFDGVEWNSEGGLCIDMSYKPRVTPLLWVAAEAPKWKIANGLEVLLEQGYAQYEKWTGLQPPKELMRQAIGCDIL